MTSFSRSWGVALVTALPLLFACAASDDEAGADVGRAGTAGAGDAPDTDAPTTIAFQPSTPLALTPGERRELEVAVAPPGSHRVRFALLGESLDASLDRTEAETDRNGNASVWLIAPSEELAAVFRVRAIAETVSAELQVAVSSSGFARLEVRPEYAGTRTIAWWRASVHLGARCQDITSNPPPDGDFARDAVFRTFPQLTGIPAGETLAVSVRGENMAGGCADVPSLSVTDLNVVKVPITDVPLKLAETDLRVKLAFDSITPGADALVTPVIEAALPEVLGTAPNDAVALLDEMQASVADPDAPLGFAERRLNGSWDATLGSSTAWGAGDGASDPIRRAVASVLDRVTTTIESGMDLEAALTAASVPGTALFRPTALAGISATEAGLTDTEASWIADPADVVLLGARLRWDPTPFVTNLAEATAAADDGTPIAVEELLAAEIDCAGVASILIDAGLNPDAGLAFAECDASCLEDLCAIGLNRLWQRARQASGAEADINVSATGSAYVDGEARVTGFIGQWLGGLTSGGSPLATVQGNARGTPYEFVSPPAR